MNCVVSEWAWAAGPVSTETAAAWLAIVVFDTAGPVYAQSNEEDLAAIASLAEVYGDTEWQLFDPDTGAVRFTGSLEACEAATRPDVDPAYQNHCVQCLPEYMPEDATITSVIPMEPVPVSRGTPTNQTGPGIALNGVRLVGPAPELWVHAAGIA